MYDAENYRAREDRINRVRFHDFKKIPATRKGEIPQLLVASDDLFRLQTGAAYAESWAMTFYLVETQPSKFSQYIKKTVSRPPFTKYTSAKRTADFTAFFGNNWELFDAQFRRYMEQLGE